MVTFEDIKNNHDINTYIAKADEALGEMGFTEHAFAHVTRCAEYASGLLEALGYSVREQELAKIAGYIHDIGNIVNRVDHAQSGAVMAFRLLDKLGMEADEISTIICAVGNHDEATAQPVSAVAAALILADKTDVRRSRVRNTEPSTFDIHDRVNYAVSASSVRLDKESGEVVLDLTIDTDLSPVMSYFEIFLGRMMLCRKAADYFSLKFVLFINGQRLL